jgi:hypothetical protein
LKQALKQIALMALIMGIAAGFWALIFDGILETQRVKGVSPDRGQAIEALNTNQ